MQLPNVVACIALGIFLALGSCSLMPADGPTSMDVRGGQADPEGLPYATIKLTPQVIDILATEAPSLSAAFADRRPPGNIRFGVGDVVSVTVFEAGAGGLFIPSEAGVRPGNFVNIPNQRVDYSGNITMPYAPPIRAAGRTAPQVQKSIVEALKSRAIDPQVIVSLVEQRTSLISVLGEVNTPTRFPANFEPERLLDAITRAGGPKGQGFDTWVMLERSGRRATIPFGALVYEPSNNIYVHPNDSIFVYREPQTFLVFGASGRQSTGGGGGLSQQQLPFDAWRISLAEAMAKAGGLSDDRADPAAIFLYRGETRVVAERLGINTSQYPGPIIPVIYLIDFRDPAGYFLATKFAMRNKDVIYISNALAVESTKAMVYFRTIIGTLNDPVIAATNALVFRNLLATSTTVSPVFSIGGASP